MQTKNKVELFAVLVMEVLGLYYIDTTKKKLNFKAYRWFVLY